MKGKERGYQLLPLSLSLRFHLPVLSTLRLMVFQGNMSS